MTNYHVNGKSGHSNILDEAVNKLAVKSRSIVLPHKIGQENQNIITEIILDLINSGLYKKPLRILKRHFHELGVDINFLQDSYLKITRQNKFLFDLAIADENSAYRFANFNSLLIFLFYIDFQKPEKTTAEGFDFFNINLSDTIFIKTDFSKSNLCNSSVLSSFFYKCSFRNADFENTSHKYCGFYKCDFANAYLHISDFSYTSFIDTVFRKASIYGADFSGSNMKNVEFRSAYLQDCRFENTILSKVMFP